MRSAPSVSGARSFQSSPGPKAGRYLPRSAVSSPNDTFQSSPGPKAGRYENVYLPLFVARFVSILARPEGRALLYETTFSWPVNAIIVDSLRFVTPKGRFLRPDRP